MQGGKNWILPKDINANRFLNFHRPEGKTTYVPLWDRMEGERGYGLKKYRYPLSTRVHIRILEISSWALNFHVDFSKDFYSHLGGK
jgi:hypothetical protein